MKYLAYFQAYTNTYAELQHLKRLYEEALSVDNVVGIIIGTRPDCMPQELLDYLAALSRRAFVMIEYGAESANNRTLAIINRGHTWEETAEAVRRTASQGILCGLHLILGLPGEDEDDILTTADKVSGLPVDVIKLHQLQLIKGTKLARQVEQDELQIRQWSVDEYIGLCLRFIERTRVDIAIERFVSQSPDNLLISPRWGLKNYEFTNRLNAEILRRGITQGSKAKQSVEN